MDRAHHYRATWYKWRTILTRPPSSCTWRSPLHRGACCSGTPVIDVQDMMWILIVVPYSYSTLEDTDFFSLLIIVNGAFQWMFLLFIVWVYWRITCEVDERDKDLSSSSLLLPIFSLFRDYTNSLISPHTCVWYACHCWPLLVAFRTGWFYADVWKRKVHHASSGGSLGVLKGVPQLNELMYHQNQLNPV